MKKRTQEEFEKLIANVHREELLSICSLGSGNHFIECNVDDEGAFYHLKYYLENKSDYLEVATTRPETLFGDTAVAVNEDDPRYQKYIGKLEIKLLRFYINRRVL